MKALAASLWAALSTYSKIPCPQVEFNARNRRFSLCFFPLVGTVVGAALALWLELCRKLGLGGGFQGALGCLIPLLITGGIHMDGFMDTLDARAAWQSREKRLAILKDSHTGAFAVMGCAGYLLAHAGILSQAGPGPVAWTMALGFVLSRALSALNLLTMPSARPGGMADGFIRSAAPRGVKAALGITAGLCAGAMALLGPAGWAALALGGVCWALFRRMALASFGGITGDLAGFFLESFELCAALGAVLGQGLEAAL